MGYINLTLIEWFGLGGFAIASLDLILIYLQHRKDKPIIKIKKKFYKKHKKFDEISDIKYANKAIRGEFNNGALNYEIRELVVDITNEGHRDAKLKGILPLYEQEGRNDYSPKIINFFPTTISAGDREEIHLFFEFPLDIIKGIEKKLPNIINVKFDFAHKKMKGKFWIGKNSFANKKR